MALVALVALVAFGTTANVDSLMSSPVSESFLTSLLATALDLIFEPVTAFFLICFVPTLFLGRFAAAYAVPLSATKSARSEIAILGDGIRRYFFMFDYSLAR